MDAFDFVLFCLEDPQSKRRSRRPTVISRMRTVDAIAEVASVCKALNIGLELPVVTADVRHCAFCFVVDSAKATEMRDA